MRTILIIGAGKSAASLVKYLLDKSNTEKLQIRLARVLEGSSVRVRVGAHHPSSVVKMMMSADHLRAGGATAKAIAAKLAPRSGLRPIDLDSYSRLPTNSGLMP